MGFVNAVVKNKKTNKKSPERTKEVTENLSGPISSQVRDHKKNIHIRKTASI